MTPVRIAGIAASAFLLLGLCQCGPQPMDKASYGYDVTLRFTPDAAAKIAGLREKVVVAAYYFGAPTPAGKPKVDEEGKIDLGDEKPEFEAVNQTVHMSGAAVNKALLPYVEGGRPMVLINVYSARRVDPDNLLNCGIFQDDIKRAQATPVAIDCDLIYPDKVLAK